MSETEALFTTIAAAIISPFVTELLKRVSWVDERLGALINAVVLILAATVGWYFLRDPSGWGDWLKLALAAAGLSGVGHNVVSKKLGKPSGGK